MTNFSAPTFSLGFEFDLDSEPQNPPSPKLAPQPSTSADLRTVQDFSDDDFESPPKDTEPPRSFKRLRRGLANEPPPAPQNPDPVDLWRNVDDEIEDFSSQEDTQKDESLWRQPHSVCRSSNFSLPGHGFITTQSTRKKKLDSNAPSTSNLESSGGRFTFPKVVTSPLRRFKLIDSDSDDYSISEAPNKSEATTSKSCQNSSLKEQKKIDDLWSNFSDKNFRIATPALDEVCEEYFKSVGDKHKHKDESKGNSSIKINEQNWNSGDPIPPAHRYFFSDDQRIQELVRTRLPNFFPLGAVYKQSTSSVIDYMDQFNKGEGPSTSAVGRKRNSETSSTRSRKTRKKSNAEEVPEGSGNWVNPRASGQIPKDASQKRVCAESQSAGHWYTGSNGKRVYVTKGGKEMSGRTAYRHYKKESGGGFKRPKKKATSRKKK